MFDSRSTVGTKEKFYTPLLRILISGQFMNIIICYKLTGYGCYARDCILGG